MLLYFNQKTVHHENNLPPMHFLWDGSDNHLKQYNEKTMKKHVKQPFHD